MKNPRGKIEVFKHNFKTKGVSPYRAFLYPFVRLLYNDGSKNSRATDDFIGQVPYWENKAVEREENRQSAFGDGL